MLAYCGLNCDDCPAYKGTMSADEGMLREAAAKWHVEGGIENVVCLGCKGDERLMFGYCAGCEMRRCAMAKGHSICAVCDDYDSCTRIHGFVDSMPSVRARMDLLHRKIKG